MSDNGYQAPGNRTHIQVVMNIDTWNDDIEGLEPGTVVISNADVKAPGQRDYIIHYTVPMK